MNCKLRFYYILHGVKSAQIRSFFWSVFYRIQTEYGENPGKYEPEKTPSLDTFRALLVMNTF